MGERGVLLLRNDLLGFAYQIKTQITQPERATEELAHPAMQRCGI